MAAFTLASTVEAAQRPPLSMASCNALLSYGAPVIKKENTTTICREGYVTLYDNVAKIPVWTAWKITPEHVNGCVKRSNKFAADRSLPQENQSTPYDYVGSGYDRGHMANDSHQSWNTQVEEDSFLMSNMVPQLAGLNRGAWKLLETSTGAWTVSTQHTLQVYAGPIYNVVTDKKIGKDQVDVPFAFYKIVIDTKTGTTLAFLFPHKENQGNDLSGMQVTVTTIEAASGVSFGVPAGHNKTLKEPAIPTDFKGAAAAKKTLCGMSDY